MDGALQHVQVVCDCERVITEVNIVSRYYICH